MHHKENHSNDFIYLLQFWKFVLWKIQTLYIMYSGYFHHHHHLAINPLLSPSQHCENHLSIQVFSELMSFGFVLWSTKFNQGDQCDPEFGTIHWSLVGSPHNIRVKAMTVPQNHLYPVVPKERYDSITPSWSMTDLWQDKSWVCQVMANTADVYHKHNICVTLRPQQAIHSMSPYWLTPTVLSCPPVLSPKSQRNWYKYPI